MNVQEFYSLYQQCGKVTIDSRKIEPKDIFFAFSGENFNAATLAEQAIEKGALAAIVEQKEYENLDKNIFYTPSTLTFLQELSQFHRQQLKIPIIGLTGSNGKTTTKELISAVLSQKYKVQFTFGNLNNHIGVPLTLLSIKLEHDIAVVEMGANHQKEIQELCELAQPNIGYITNFGKAHLEGFGGFEGVIKGKSELYDYLKQNHQTILLNLNDDLQKERVGNYAPVISFGTPDADYYFEQLAEDNFVGLGFKGEVAQSHLTGNYNFTNLCAAASLGFHFGLSFQQIKHAIEGYTPTNMRSQVMVKDGKTLVLDTYNANPSSMAASLQNFKSFEGSKTVIMGDMLELGEESLAEHRAILALAQSLNFETIITVGKEFAEVTNNNFKTTTELIDYLQKHSIDTQNILLKGSRGIALEKIIEYL
ncbi:UDP-N-acetylmuramoyl-tripeptide--D-alanyl-D-alanine ligase [Bergeyella porcorum]|uniref:UDP-N-acetylmuramoyl-tripeptide--D-alanyl-D-alanine ligase n=1 Tax=Bergeyella porcorum TaxID=1735111 RepID=A0AAU0EZZ1_9FLAO